MSKVRNPKGSFKADLLEWKVDGVTGKVSRIGSKPVFAYTAFNEKPKMLVIHIAGPDDMGREKDVHVDLKSLIQDLKKNNLIK